MRRCYRGGGSSFLLSIEQLDIPRGSKLAFIGESGSGKSTLLELLALLARPDDAERFEFKPQADSDPIDISALWQQDQSAAFAALRSRHIGYIMQTGGLLPYLSVAENIELPLQLLQRSTTGTARHWAERLGISEQLNKLPSMLSVGQRQRAEVARALAHDPAILIADEPTSAVDPFNAERMVNLLCKLADESGVTLLLATHAQRLATQFGLELIEHRIRAIDEQNTEVIIRHGGGDEISA